MDTRDEEDLTIQIPSHDGSQTERTRGTFGGRQRWLSNATGTNGAETSKGGNVSLLASPRKIGGNA